VWRSASAINLPLLDSLVAWLILISEQILHFMYGTLRCKHRGSARGSAKVRQCLWSFSVVFPNEFTQKVTARNPTLNIGQGNCNRKGSETDPTKTNGNKSGNKNVNVVLGFCSLLTGVVSLFSFINERRYSEFQTTLPGKIAKVQQKEVLVSCSLKGL